jgi:Fe2+ or Zn2+ uptake regulation protein
MEKEIGIYMSQEAILKILKELGGEATIQEIRAKAKSKYPTTTLYTYAIDRLRKLKKWDEVDFVRGKWRIKKPSKH